jgi:carboxyl-terminal processing protease
MNKPLFISLFIIIALCFQSSAERFGGAGLIVAQLFDPATSTKAGETVVLGVLPDGSAKTQGVKPGDVIVEIDEKVTRGVEFDAIVNSLRGKIGSTVKLKIKRTGTDTLLSFTITRAEYSAPAAK